VAAVKALFVGGPWHGTVREVPEKQHTIHVPRLDPGGMAVRREYRREQVATSEVDGYATVDAWLYDDLSPTGADVDRRLADALLRVAIRDRQVGYRFTERQDWHRPEPSPELAEVERCTPTVYAQRLLEVEAERKRQHREEVERQIQALVESGVPRSMIQPNGEQS
jgi:hypothetical protein